MVSWNDIHAFEPAHHVKGGMHIALCSKTTLAAPIDSVSQPCLTNFSFLFFDVHMTSTKIIGFKTEIKNKKVLKFLSLCRAFEIKTRLIKLSIVVHISENLILLNVIS